ncbi:hypothetical protein ACWD9K_37095 [Streptomyces sp. 900116325]
MPGRVILAVDISHYAAVWQRPARIGVPMPARAMGAQGLAAD